MNQGRLVFAQLMQHLPLTTFRRCVTRLNSAVNSCFGTLNIPNLHFAYPIQRPLEDEIRREAHLLKESFGQLWDYEREGWARRFFDNWRASLKWQRLEPYEKFAEMIERHWDGIAAYCKPENKVSLGFVEGLNNKIRVIQCRAYGLRDEEYLRLKILTCMLPELYSAVHNIGYNSGTNGRDVGRR